MKRLCITMLLLASPSLAFAADLDPAYFKTFGYGTVVASGKGYPSNDKYDPAQITFKDGTYFVEGGPDGTLDLRALLPRGMTIGKALARTKKARGANLKYRQSDFMAFRIWLSHDGGTDLVNGKPWPKKGELPGWADAKVNQTYDLTSEAMRWPGAGLRWNEIRADATSFNRLQKGAKLYVTFHVGYRYKTPAGAIENKWDDQLRKFVQRKSVGLLGFEYGEPLAAATVEVTGAAGQADRFKVAADGVKDTKTGLTWGKSPTVKGRFIAFQGKPSAADIAKGLGAGWRLPTMDELKELRKAGGANPVEFFNAHGFSGVRAAYYWSGFVRGAGQVGCITMAPSAPDPAAYSEETDELLVWPVRN